MVTKIKNRLTRQTTLIDHVTQQPWIITLVDGGKMIYLHPKRHRVGYRIPLSAVIVQAGRMKVGERRGMKKAPRPAHV